MRAMQKKIHHLVDSLGIDREALHVSVPGSIEALMGSLRGRSAPFRE